MCCFTILGVVIVLIVILLVISHFWTPKKLDIHDEHVLVTGGSSGIGKAVAVEAAKRGANVTLLARNKAKLAEAKILVDKHMKDPSKQRVLTMSVDLSEDYDDVEKAVREAEASQGPVAMLVNCAGLSIAGRFEDIPVNDFKKLMSVNYLGSVLASKAVVPGMKARGRGRIVFISSQAGQIGLYGFSAYSASKYALRGLAESLQMEVKPYNIRVTLCFPPDTDTPGYEEENKHKPRETQLISETAGLFKPDYVADCILKHSLAGHFVSYIGMDGWMLAQVTSGMSPMTSLIETVLDLFIMGILRVVGIGYLTYFDSLVKKCKIEKEREMKKQ